MKRDPRVSAADKSGNTAVPQPDNAIYNLAAALTRLATLQFPIELDDTTRAYFGRTATSETGQVRAGMLAISKPTPDVAAAHRLAS